MSPLITEKEVMHGLKFIGKGLFTKAYLNDEGYVILHSICPIKECMSFNWFPESTLFPEIECISLNVYKMKYYPKVRSLKNNLDPDQWQIYQELRRLPVPYFKHINDSFSTWHDIFKTLENEELRETLAEALDACANYGSDIAFEISPRNVASDNGKLVLLDCFFSISKSIELRK